MFCCLLFYYCVCMKHITLCNCLCSSSSRDSASVIQNIREFEAKNYFIDHWTANKIHGFRDSVQSLKYMAVIRIRKNLSNFPFLSKRYKVRTVCWCKTTHFKQFSNTSNCIYLLKLYDKSIITLLANVLTNICNEISKIRLILLMVYTFNVKEFEQVEK